MPISRALPSGMSSTTRPLPDHRLQILRNLIARRQVGVEIILAVEDARQIDLGVEAEPGLDRLLDAKPVDDRQHARKSRIDRRDLGVGLGPERGRRPRKQFRLGDHLGMDFEPDHGLPRPAVAFDHRHAPTNKKRSGATLGLFTVGSPRNRTITGDADRSTCRYDLRPLRAQRQMHHTQDCSNRRNTSVAKQEDCHIGVHCTITTEHLSSPQGVLCGRLSDTSGK